MASANKSDKRFETVTLRPFCYIAPSLRASMIALFALLLVQILMLAVSGSYPSVVIIFATVASALLAEVIHFHYRKNVTFDWREAVVQGIIIGMMCPSSYPPFAAATIVFVTLLLFKYTFGGFSNSWVNVAALCIAIAYFVGMQWFPAYSLGMGQLQNRNAALLLIQNGTIPVMDGDAAVTRFLNTYIFKLFGVSIPDGYVTLLWDTHSPIPAFRFNLITLLSSIILFAFQFQNHVIPTVYVLVYALLIRFAGPAFYHGVTGQGDVLLALLSGGTLFSALFLLQWYGTTPLSITGKILYGVLGGCAAFIIAGYGTSPVGAVFTILIVNVVSPLIQLAEDRFCDRYLHAVLLPRITAMREEDNG